MPKYALSNHGYMALGLYIGFKSSYRRAEMKRFGINYEEALNEFRRVGLATGNRVNLDLAREAFRERFDHGLGSQTHMYAAELGYPPISYY